MWTVNDTYTHRETFCSNCICVRVWWQPFGFFALLIRILWTYDRGHASAFFYRELSLTEWWKVNLLSVFWIGPIFLSFSLLLLLLIVIILISLACAINRKCRKWWFTKRTLYRLTKAEHNYKDKRQKLLIRIGWLAAWVESWWLNVAFSASIKIILWIFIYLLLFCVLIKLKRSKQFGSSRVETWENCRWAENVYLCDCVCMRFSLIQYKF